ncbi:MAG TPA: flagellin [Planctomycetaceae bacterium]|nr:flagellin [Planctomycetaceae bacterium]
MTRINTNVSSLVAQNRLNKTNSDLQTSLTRLSTGLRINTGKDDPAGLIASEALRSDITGINKAISNTQRASQIIATADSALGQVSSLLNDVRGLVVEAANNGALSDDEIAANQLQIDSSLEAINRIAQTTTFQGRKLLDGSLDFTSTIDAVATVTDAKIDQANLGATGTVAVDVEITAAAQQATLSAASSAFTTSANASVTDTVDTFALTVAGETVNVTAPSTLASISIVDSAAAGTGQASFDADTNILTITADFTGGDGASTGSNGTATGAAIAAAIDGLDNFVSSAVTGTAAAADVVPGAPTINDDVAGLTVTAANAGSEYNNVTVNFVSGSSNSADYDSTAKVLTVTVDSASTQTSAAIATAIGSHTIDGAAGTALFSATGGTNVSYSAGDLPDSLNTGSTGGEVLNADVVFQLNGSSGADTFNFKAGASAQQIASAINLVSDATNVTAAVSSGALALTSVDYGTDSLVDLEVISEGTGGTFEAALSTTRDAGSDIVATVNGVSAKGDANTLSINTATLDLSLTVDAGSSTNFAFEINGGGALFQLGGDVVSNQQARLGIGSLSTGKLGGASGRLYELGSGQAKALDTDVTGAGKVIDEVINKVTSLRGRLGAFQATTLESNMVSLNDTVANLTEAESSIRDADFAAESARLTRAQILVQSGTSVLGIANQNPQNVLGLLR